MTTEIEKLWQSSANDEAGKAMNGTLLEQSTFICPSCGFVKPSPAECTNCNDPGDLDA